MSDDTYLMAGQARRKMGTNGCGHLTFMAAALAFVWIASYLGFTRALPGTVDDTKIVVRVYTDAWQGHAFFPLAYLESRVTGCDLFFFVQVPAEAPTDVSAWCSLMKYNEPLFSKR